MGEEEGGRDRRERGRKRMRERWERGRTREEEMGGGIIYPKVDDGGGASVRVGPRMELPQVLQVGKQLPICGDGLRRGREGGREGEKRERERERGGREKGREGGREGGREFM